MTKSEQRCREVKRKAHGTQTEDPIQEHTQKWILSRKSNATQDTKSKFSIEIQKITTISQR
jgi:hypothetical protein